MRLLLSSLFSRSIKTDPNVDPEGWYQEYWNRMFNSKRYLKKLLKSQQELIDRYESLCEQIQIDITNNQLTSDELLKEIKRKCFSVNYRYSLNFKGSVPNDVDKR